MSAAAGRTITENHLDAYAAETKQGYRLPAELVGAWVQVTGSRRVLDIICGAVNLYAVDDTERQLAEVGRVQIQQERLAKHLETIKGDTSVDEIRQRQLQWPDGQAAPKQLLDPSQYLVTAQRLWFQRKLEEDFVPPPEPDQS